MNFPVHLGYTSAYTAYLGTDLNAPPQLDKKISIATKEKIFQSIQKIGIEEVHMLCMDRLDPNVETGEHITSRDTNTNAWMASLNVDEIKIVYDFTGASMDYSERHFY